MVEEETLKIVRESIAKREREKKEENKPNKVSEYYKKKRVERMSIKGGKHKFKAPFPSWKPALNHAVEFVKEERKLAGLPADSKREEADIEEKLVREELRDKKGVSIQSDLDTYLDTNTFTKKIVYGNWAERVAYELRDWILKERGPNEKEPMKITEFFREKGIFHRDFHRLKMKYPILQDAYDFAIQAIGDVRERNVLENKWNTQAGMFMMRHYDEDWRKEADRRDAAKTKQTSNTNIDLKALVTDLLTPVPSTEEVRVKVEKDKKKISSSKP
jgi:hypothetical protein